MKIRRDEIQHYWIEIWSKSSYIIATLIMTNILLDILLLILYPFYPYSILIFRMTYAINFHKQN